MRQRCANPNHPQFKDWGGRGIVVCDRWQVYANFLADMGEKPDDRFIERDDNDGNYEPGNCRWATRSEQLRNTRRNHHLTHDGITLCVADWADRIGVKRNTIYHRLNVGWSIEETLTVVPKITGRPKRQVT